MQRTVLLTFFLFLVCAILSVRTIASTDDFVFAPLNVSQGLSDNQVRYISQLPDGRMIFTTNGNLNIYDGVRFTYIHRSNEHVYSLSKYDGFYRVYQSCDSLLWIKEHNKLLCVQLCQEKYMVDVPAYFQRKGIEAAIENLFVDAQRQMWLLVGGELIGYDGALSLDVSENSGELQDVDVRGTCLYLFYNTGEVVCYEMTEKKRLYAAAAYPEHRQADFKKTSLVVGGNDGFYQLRNGKKGGFFFFDIKTSTWKTLLETDYTLNTLIVTPQETAYISSAHGVWQIEPRTGNYRQLPSLKTTDNTTVETELSTLFYDAQGGLWVGTYNRGLLYYHPERYKLKHVGRANFGHLKQSEIQVQSFAEAADGKMYLKSNSDYFRYNADAKNEVLQSVQRQALPEDVYRRLNSTPSAARFGGKTYTSVCTDTRGWTWAGTHDGLLLFKPDSIAGQIFYTENGLVNNFVHAVLEDRNNDIWVTTSYGISQLRIDTIQDKIIFTNYNSLDGALNGEYLNGSVFESSDGTLYFGGVDGFNVLKPGEMPFSPLPFKPVFTRLYLRGEEVKIGKHYDERIILPQSTVYTHRLDLSHHQHFLSLEFSALNYRNQAQTYYRYFLEGIDTHWNETAASGYDNNAGTLTMSYTNLPIGKYKLKVMASDNPQHWNNQVSEVDIFIHAPWWKTPTAYFLYVLLVLIAVFGSIYIYMYATKKKLKRKHKEEILLLRIKNLIDQCSQYETALKSDTETNETQLCESAEKDEFIMRAMEMVEKNLNTQGYSVEQLSHDLCMDRTGLYRKLTTLLDESPTLFIRNIRLRRAAQLIVENKMSITEISENVGFSSMSYMSKCFQEMYGCRPSEYLDKYKNQPR